MLLKKFFNLGFEAIAVHGRRPFGLDQLGRYPLFSAEFLDLLRRSLPAERLAELVFSIVVTARRPFPSTAPGRCSACRHDNPVDARVCSRCGTRFEESPASAVPAADGTTGGVSA